MSRNRSPTELRNILADLYSDIPRSREVVLLAELRPGTIAFDAAADSNWHNILLEAQRHSKVQAIVDIACRDWPNRAEELSCAARAYLNWFERIEAATGAFELHLSANRKTCITASLKTPLETLLEPHRLFGGRNDELARLDAFLTDQPKGYLFVTGRSGFGKSALLTNWIASLNHPVCYHFINRLAGSASAQATLEDLCEQLASHHGLAGSLTESLPRLRRLYPLLLRIPPGTDEKLIVVLDGLDEAADWNPQIGPDLFPHDLPEGIYVVFSARQISDLDWLQELGLPRAGVRTLPLTKMGIGEIASLLRVAGDAAGTLADDPSFLQSMFDRSDGDPFYLSLLVQDIQHGAVTPMNVADQPSGLDAYLGKWWKQLTEDVEIARDEVYDLLGLLVVALGPLTPKDLAGSSRRLRRGGLLHTELSSKLRRYLTGDWESGYRLCHPRFAEYLQKSEIFFPEEIETYREQLLDYCARWQQHGSRYAISRYTLHLTEVGRSDQLHALLREETEDGRNAWQQARERLGQTSGYLEDVDRAWRLAEKTQEIGLQCRYALITTSLNSLATNIPPALQCALVENGMWTLTQGLAYARQVPAPDQRAKALAGVARHLSDVPREEVLGEALAAIGEIRSEGYRAPALTTLAPDLPEPLLERALAEALRFKNSQGRSEALVGLARHLPHSMRIQAAEMVFAAAQEMLEMPAMGNRLGYHLARYAVALGVAGQGQTAKLVVQLIGDEGLQEQALAVLATVLPESPSSRQMEEALEAARLLDPANRAMALIRLSAQLPEPLRQEALQGAVTSIPAGPGKDTVLAALVPHLPGLHCVPEPLSEHNDDVHQLALACARGISNKRARAKVLAGLIAYLPGPLQESVGREALALAHQTEDRRDRAEALAELTPYLAEAQRKAVLHDALELVGAIGDEATRVEALAELTAHLPEPERTDAQQEALTTAEAIRDKRSRAEALAKLVSRLPEPLREEAMQGALAAARRLDDSQVWTEVLARMVSYLPEQELRAASQEALAAAQSHRDGTRRAQALTALVPHLSEEMRAEALVVAEEMRGHTPYRAWQELVEALASHPPKDQLPQTLAFVRGLKNPRARAKGLAKLAPHLPERLLEEAMDAALAAAREASDSAWVWELIDWAPHLSGEQSREALVLACGIEDENYQARALVALAPYLTGELSLEALAVAWGIEDVVARVTALAALAPHLPEPEQGSALKEIMVPAPAPRLFGQTFALTRLAPHLTGVQKLETLAAIQALEECDRWLWAMHQLTSELPWPQNQEATAEIANWCKEPGPVGQRRWKVLEGLILGHPEAQRKDLFPEAARRPEKLAALAADLSAPLKGTTLRWALELAQEIRHESYRVEVVARLVPHLPEPQQREALRWALEAAQEIGNAADRVETLVQLAPELSEPLRSKALEAALMSACQTEDASSRARLPTILMLKLLAIRNGDAVPTVWAQTLPLLAARTRRDLLSALRSLTPRLFTLVGEATAVEMFYAIRDVGRWWP